VAALVPQQARPDPRLLPRRRLVGRVQRRGQLPQVLGRVEEVQDHRLDPREARPQQVFQARPAVAEGHPHVGPIQTHLRPLTA